MKPRFYLARAPREAKYERLTDDYGAKRYRGGSNRGLWTARQTNYFVDKDGRMYFMTKGWETDFVSASDFWLMFLPEMDDPSALHDEMVQNPAKISKAKADAVFRRAMEAYGISFFWRWAVWGYVRVFHRSPVNWPQKAMTPLEGGGGFKESLMAVSGR